MKRALELIEDARPAWFRPEARRDGALVGTAHLLDWSVGGLSLIISDADEPRASEAVRGVNLPRACSERHIEGDGRFCLGLDRKGVASRSQAQAWWGHLEQFIRCQSAARATGVWPLGYGLDHGDAGEYHRRALRLAERLGISEAYFDTWLDQPSWISGEGLLRIGDKAGRLKPGAFRPRKPRVYGGRRARLKLFELVILERARRRRIAAFWRAMAQSGRTCCGTMRDCRLRRPSAANDGVGRTAA